MIQGCQYPECNCQAVTTWALVPVCIDHYTKILIETLSYYEKAIDRYADRRHLLRINHLIPWRNKQVSHQRWGRR